MLLFPRVTIFSTEDLFWSQYEHYYFNIRAGSCWYKYFFTDRWNKRSKLLLDSLLDFQARMLEFVPEQAVRWLLNTTTLGKRNISILSRFGIFFISPIKRFHNPTDLVHILQEPRERVEILEWNANSKFGASNRAKRSSVSYLAFLFE